MSGEFNISRQLEGGYIISEADTLTQKRLVETFSEKGAPPDISLTFQDGRTVNSTEPDDVLII